MNQMKYFPLWTTLLEKLRLKSPYTYDTILLFEIKKHSFESLSIILAQK